MCFSEEVLKKYFDHPEKYCIEDTESGGEITTPYETAYFFVQYGKRTINNDISIVVLYKDLTMLENSEQQHWSSYEINNCKIDQGDDNFRRFVQRNYYGEFVEYSDPIKNLTIAIDLMNKVCRKNLLFKKNKNMHLCPPVENTQKAYCDSCSELYKIIGPDNIDQNALKRILFEKWNMQETELQNKESHRPYSCNQLFKLLEDRLMGNNKLTEVIDQIKKSRIDADHKILEPDFKNQNYTKQFYVICKNFVVLLNQFSGAFRSFKKDC